MLLLVSLIAAAVIWAAMVKANLVVRAPTQAERGQLSAMPWEVAVKPA